MKQVLKALHQRPIAVYPIYIDLTGSIAGGLLLSQLLYWLEKVDREIWKTDAEIMSETRLTQTEFKNAKKAIAALPFMSVTKRGVPPKTYYSVDWDGLGIAIESLISSVTYQLNRRLSTSQRGGNLPNGRSVTYDVIHRLPSETSSEITSEEFVEYNSTVLLDEVDETSVEIHHVPEYFDTEKENPTPQVAPPPRPKAKREKADDPAPITAMWQEYEKRFAALNQGEPPVFHKKYLRPLKTLFAVLRERTIKKGIVPLNDVQPWCDFLDMAAQHLKNNPKETYLRGRFDPIGIEAEFNKWITTLNNRPKTDAEKWIEWGKRQGL